MSISLLCLKHLQKCLWVGAGVCYAVLLDDMMDLRPSRTILGTVAAAAVVVAGHGPVKVVVIFAI
ncbi:hypothetical protein BDV12DRAFT_180573 [Aspergillus spectabilis]